jgi:hydroxymethylpyrimidine pyrophosphatase-like HAD family hydrolase
MKPLAPPGNARILVSLDFDGTLHDPSSTPPVPRGFFGIIKRLRVEKNVVWGINTGRSMDHMIEGFVESGFPFLPDWVVAREREILFSDADGRWHPHQPWNSRCESAIHRLFTKAGRLLKQIRSEIEQHTGARWMFFEGEPAGIISRTEEEMEWIVRHITPMTSGEPLLSWQRNSIYLRFGHRDYQKGSSLSEVAAIYQLAAADCFAMGDSHNDMEMLDPAHAAMTACPANAVDVIKAKIIANGGIVTTGIHGDGAIEALLHFLDR